MAASETLLNDLHNMVAKTLAHKMQVREVERVVKVDGEHQVVKETVEPTAAEIAAAITFLKNNSITAVPEEDSALAELQRQVAAARAKRKPVLPDPHASMPEGMH
jgi:hypothetical protein